MSDKLKVNSYWVYKTAYTFEYPHSWNKYIIGIDYTNDTVIKITTLNSSTYHYNYPKLPSGTLASPPTGLNIGDLWVDTTTSSQYPIVRMRAT